MSKKKLAVFVHVEENHIKHLLHSRTSQKDTLLCFIKVLHPFKNQSHRLSVVHKHNSHTMATAIDLKASGSFQLALYTVWSCHLLDHYGSFQATTSVQNLEVTHSNDYAASEKRYTKALAAQVSKREECRNRFLFPLYQ